MAEKSRPGKGESRITENKIQHALYVPEEQVFQRIPLCRYLSDLSALFENEEIADDPAEKKEQP